MLGRKSIVDVPTALLAIVTVGLLWKTKKIPEPLIILVAALFASLVFFGLAAVSFADEHSPQDIQTLKDAASALKASNPDLSDQLSRYADKEAGEKGEAEEKEEAEENTQGNTKLLNDSAAALQPSNPQLADALKKYADQEAQEGKEEKK